MDSVGAIEAATYSDSPSLSGGFYSAIEEVAHLSIALEPEASSWAKIPGVNVLVAGFRFGGGVIQLALGSVGATFTLLTGFVSLFVDSPSDLKERLLLREISVRLGVNGCFNLLRAVPEVIPGVSTLLALLIEEAHQRHNELVDYLPKGSLALSYFLRAQEHFAGTEIAVIRSITYESQLNLLGKIPILNIPVAMVRFCLSIYQLWVSLKFYDSFILYLLDQPIPLHQIEVELRLYANGLLNVMRVPVELIPGVSTLILGIWDYGMDGGQLINYLPEGFYFENIEQEQLI